MKSYGMDKLMVGSTMLNTVLMSTDYYVDQYLPPGEGKSHLSVSKSHLPMSHLSKSRLSKSYTFVGLVFLLSYQRLFHELKSARILIVSRS